MSRPTEEWIKEQGRKLGLFLSMSEGNILSLVNGAIDESLKDTVQIPDEKDWPKWADSVWIYYNNDSCNFHANLIKEVKRRSKPSWTPKEGDAVFYISNNLKVVMIGRFIMMDAVGNYQITSIHGNNNWIEPNSIKPFDPSKIGLLWDEI